MPRKHSYEYIYNYFLNNDCLLLENEYIDCHKNMKFICSCGRESYRSFNVFQKTPWCTLCGYEKGIKNRFLTIDEIKNELLKENCILLSTEYHSNKQILDFKCNCGQIGHKTWNDLQYAMYCSECGVKSRSGKNHYRYDFTKTEEERHDKRRSSEYKKWVKNIYKRDNYMCQICESNIKLQAHHLYSYIKYKNMRFDFNNGITLCKKCHDEFHKFYKSDGNNTKEQFDEYINNKLDNICNF